MVAYTSLQIASRTQEVSILISVSIVNKAPDRLGGTLVFSGNRVPVKAIFDYLENGDSLDELV
ncbi:MAG: DUF433 domain-containing protein [Granulosicoccus sp.]